jgi:hypothetical protein
MANGTIAVSSVEILSQSGTGVITVNPPATNTNRTITLPDGTGTLVANGVNSSIVSGTAVTCSGQTSIDFTGIPSWVKRITVMFSGVSTSGTSLFLVQLGDAGGFEITGYASQANSITTTPAVTATTNTAGFVLGASALVAASTYSGTTSIVKLDGNSWVYSSLIIRDGTASSNFGSGSKPLSDTLTQVRITTVNGTDTFDTTPSAGKINILYE